MKRCVPCQFAMIGLLSASSTLADVTIRALGPAPGSTSNSPRAMSANGLVVVGESRFSDHNAAYRWDADTGMVTLDSVESTAWGTSADGSIVVGVRTIPGGRDRAFRWTASSGLVPLPFFPGGGTNPMSRAQGISANGEVIVGSCTEPVNRELVPTRWTSTGIQALGMSRADSHGASANGSVIVGSREGGKGYFEAFRWSVSTGVMGLGSLPDGRLESYSSGVSDDGLVVVGGSNYDRNSGNVEAFRWTAEHGMVGLGFLPGHSRSFAYAASGDGHTIVGYSDIGAAGAPFIWTLGRGMRPLRTVLETDYGLDLSGWTLGAARAVSADGTAIAGEGASPAGQSVTWLVSGLPELCVADVTGDRAVDLADLATLLSGFGCAGGACVDLTGDGETQLDDLTLLLQKFGTGCP